MVKTFGGARFEMDTLTLSPKQVLEMMRIRPVAHAEFKKALANYNASGVFGFAGGLLIAVPLATAAVGGQAEWGVAGAGAALMLVTIPLTKAFRRHAQNALDEYNKQPHTSRVKTNFYLTGNGARVVIRF